ncbi:sacsin N-terminal ATP-binding-like domain-containing protein, partial [Parabacteroides distasonis]
MVSKSIIEKLREIYQSLPKVELVDKGDGWVNQYDFLRAVGKVGINYKNLGYDHFYEFLTDSGLFSFWTDFSGEKPIRYVIEKAKPKSHEEQRRPQYNRAATQYVDSEEVVKIKRRLRLENNQFIGQFARKRNEGWFTITDIRNTDFTKIEDKERGIKNLSISFRSNKEFNRYAYYKFTWVLLETDPLKFGIDLHEEITPIYPKDIVSSLYEGIMRYPAGAAKKIARSLDTLKKQLTQSGKEVFIYELLQNANDYPLRTKIDGKIQPLPVDVEFHITENYLTFEHTGEYFNPKNIAAICDINDGEKSDNTEAIGYKGIGFKTVFLDNDYVLLNTGNYTFRFDKSATDVINTPWQILPIWTEHNEIDNEIKSVFRQHPNEEFRVKFALQPRDKEILTDEDRDDNYIDLFTDVFESERVILFIPNIKKVSIFIDGQDEPIVREKDNKDWCVSDSLVDDIPEDITDKINDVLENPDSLRSDGYEKIPEKYMNFRKTAVKFACKKAERKLTPVDDAILYCYLPAKRADWGFNFLMNTDMVPNGQRDDIEDIELNHVIARIAGKQFFYWIKQLIESKKYDLDSIFALIPDFDECKKRRVYKTFIEEFQEEFEKFIKEEPFVPCVDKDGEQTFECIDNIINDMTGMTANGVISDEDFIILMELGDYSLPVDELRQSEAFMDFLYKHSPSSLDVKVDAVVKKCEETDFQTWLTVPENNTRFIRHWLSEDELNEFAKKNIFIEYEGDLFTAGSLYYDFDTNCNGIGFLRRFVPHLCEASRANFEEDENWKSFADKYFLSFSAASMITDYILSNEDAMALLNVPSNSVAFYRYLAVKEVDLKANKTKVPYITEDGGASTDYTNYHYFFNEEAHGLIREKWLGENLINVLSHIYFDSLADDEKDNITAIFTNLGFNEFTKDSFITTVIVGDADFRAKVNAAIENNYAANKAFVEYVYGCEAQLKENVFKDYVLRCVDIHKNEVYLCNDDVRYFNQDAYAQNSTYADNINHAWLQDSMMYALSNDYFEGREKEEVKKLESFLRQQFGVKTFTDKSFFTDVVIKNKAVIYAGLVDEATMLTFLEYLKRDADRLFDDTMSFNDIKDMPLLAYDGTIVRARELNIQYIEYNEDAKILCEKAWCPKMYVVLSQKYTDDFSQDMRQLFKIVKFDINTTTDILAQNANLRQSVNVINNNVDFWRWVKVNQKQIASVDKFKTIPLLDNNNALINCVSLYISDTYQQEQIEALVTKYVKEAQFVSSSYIETANENEKSEWMKLFRKLGLKSDNKDILFSDILPKLSTIEVESLDSVVAMMTKHLKDLKDKWAERKYQIMQLRVRTQYAGYKTLDQVIIVNMDEDSVSEPFKYITLANEVHPDILKANKDLLHAISEEYGNRNLITTKQMWIDAKVKDYLAKFTADENSVADIHIQFVREVVKIQSEYDINDTLRKQIKYLVKSNETTYKLAHELTLGTEYSPTCDFEANGVAELSYLSDTYIFEGNKDIIKQYFKAENVHQNMTREDLKYLANRTFACYFWSKCFSRRLVEYESWVEDGCFNNRVCIPTENSVQKPELLYTPHIAGYAVRAKVPQWQEKVPCKAIVDSIDNRDARELFEKINFCKALSFEDCLYYLARVTHPREEETNFRSIVINWMLSSPIQDETLVDNYRKTPTAEWRNGKGQKKHITELYAIHPDATQERNIFRGDEFVMQTSAFPYDTDSFVKVCNMLKIKCLTSSDFVATPIGKQDETADMVAILRP